MLNPPKLWTVVAVFHNIAIVQRRYFTRLEAIKDIANAEDAYPQAFKKGALFALWHDGSFHGYYTAEDARQELDRLEAPTFRKVA